MHYYAIALIFFSLTGTAALQAQEPKYKKQKKESVQQVEIKRGKPLSVARKYYWPLLPYEIQYKILKFAGLLMPKVEDEKKTYQGSIDVVPKPEIVNPYNSHESVEINNRKIIITVDGKVTKKIKRNKITRVAYNPHEKGELFIVRESENSEQSILEVWNVDRSEKQQVSIQIPRCKDIQFDPHNKGKVAIILSGHGMISFGTLIKEKDLYRFNVDPISFIEKIYRNFPSPYTLVYDNYIPNRIYYTDYLGALYFFDTETEKSVKICDYIGDHYRLISSTTEKLVIDQFIEGISENDRYRIDVQLKNPIKDFTLFEFLDSKGEQYYKPIDLLKVMMVKMMMKREGCYGATTLSPEEFQHYLVLGDAFRKKYDAAVKIRKKTEKEIMQQQQHEIVAQMSQVVKEEMDRRFGSVVSYADLNNNNSNSNQIKQ